MLSSSGPICEGGNRGRRREPEGKKREPEGKKREPEGKKREPEGKKREPEGVEEGILSLAFKIRDALEWNI
jgi:hypothetical protein